MTKERAQFILANLGAFGSIKYTFENEMCLKCTASIWDQGVNENEDAFIRMIWSLMNETKSYYDALVAISEGIYG